MIDFKPYVVLSYEKVPVVPYYLINIIFAFCLLSVACCQKLFVIPVVLYCPNIV